MTRTILSATLLVCSLLSQETYAGSKNSFPDMAKRDGFEAVHTALDDLRKQNKSDAKFQEAVSARDLQGLRMPVRAILGSELVIRDPGSLRNCKIKDKIYCSISVNDFVATNTTEHHFSCKSRFGTTVPLETAAARDRDGVMVWAVSGLEKCWELGGTEILIQPISSMDLEGIGQGDEFIPPELVQLDYHQVQDIINNQMGSFRYCIQNAKESTGEGAGTLEIAFKIAEDGTVESAAPVQELYGDPELVTCLVDRFKRIKFPPPRGGYSEGRYPFTLSN